MQPPRSNIPPPRPSQSPSRHPNMMNNEPSGRPGGGTGSGLFSSIKGGAGSFLKNLKDTSSKVMQSVQQTIARNDLDITYVTSRIIVMPCPSEGLESAYKTNSIEDVKIFFETRHQPNTISVYNLGPRGTPRLAPPVRVIEAGFSHSHGSPCVSDLAHLYSVSEDMYGFLRHDEKHIIIIQCPDGKSISSTFFCALLLYAGLVSVPEDALQMFAVKRMPPNMQPSQLRYLYYLSEVISPAPVIPHHKPVTLVSVNICPIPRSTKHRDGIRPFIEVTCNDQVILSTLQDYDKMRLYSHTEGRASIQLNVTVCGDITITLLHARNSLGGMGRPNGVKVCQLQLHTGFISEEETNLKFSKSDLDYLADGGSGEIVPNGFCLALSVFVGDSERPPTRNPPWTSTKAPRDSTVLFGSQLECEETVDNFVSKPAPPRPAPPAMKPVRPAPPRPVTPNLSKNSTPEPPKEAVSDLLNLNQNDVQHTQDNVVVEENVDFLGLGNDLNESFTPLNDILGEPNTKQNTFDFLAGDTFNNQPSNGQSNTFDPFGFGDSANDTELLKPKITKESSPIEQQQQANEKQKTKDPFADLGNLSAGLNTSWGSAQSAGTSPRSTQFSSPSHHNQTPGGRSPHNAPTTPVRSPRDGTGNNSNI